MGQEQGLRVFVISLVRAVARRAYMSQLLGNLGIAAEFVTAVDGQRLTPEQRKRYDSGKARRVYGCEMTDNEIACYLSHLKAYTALVEAGDDSALVLEDDISCDARLMHILRALTTQAASEWSVLRLQSTKTSVAEPTTKEAYGETIGQLAGHDICRIRTSVLGGCGYVIRQRAARRMLARSRRIFMPIDQTLDRYWENGIVPYVLRPLPVWHEDAFPSEIGERGRSLAAAPRGIALLARRTQRLIDSANKRLFWLTFSSRRGKPPTLRPSVGRLGALAAALLAAVMVGFYSHSAAEADTMEMAGSDRLAALSGSPTASAPIERDTTAQAAGQAASSAPAAVGVVQASSGDRRCELHRAKQGGQESAQDRTDATFESVALPTAGAQADCRFSALRSIKAGGHHLRWWRHPRPQRQTDGFTRPPAP